MAIIHTRKYPEGTQNRNQNFKNRNRHFDNRIGTANLMPGTPLVETYDISSCGVDDILSKSGFDLKKGRLSWFHDFSGYFVGVDHWKRDHL